MPNQDSEEQAGQQKWWDWKGGANEPSMADLEQIARRIEAMIDKAHLAVIKLADIKSGEALETFFEMQSSMLLLDEHSKELFKANLEEKRVRTLAQESIVMTCVMSAAVALSQFKNQPRSVSSAPLDRMLLRVRSGSTHPLTLLAFSVASLYAVIGRGAFRHVRQLRNIIKTK